MYGLSIGPGSNYNVYTQVFYKPPKAKDTLLAILVFFASFTLQAEAPPVEYQLKAELLERFTSFIDWPANSAVSDPSVPFMIGIVGHNPFGSYLDRFSQTTIKGKKVQVIEVSNLEDIDRCQVVFVARSEEKNLADILFKTTGKPILTVADTDGFARKGVLINFYQYDDYIRFEVNQAAVDKSGLKFSSRLLKLARFVEPEKK